MSDMRLIVAGAGGRMGRALTRAIADSKGAVLAGALEAPGSELLGKHAGILAEQLRARRLQRAGQQRAFGLGNRTRQRPAHPAAGSSNNQAHVGHGVILSGPL